MARGLAAAAAADGAHAPARHRGADRRKPGKQTHNDNHDSNDNNDINDNEHTNTTTNSNHKTIKHNNNNDDDNAIRSISHV